MAIYIHIHVVIAHIEYQLRSVYLEMKPPDQHTIPQEGYIYYAPLSYISDRSVDSRKPNSAYLNTDYNFDTTANAVQKAVYTMTLNIKYCV